MRLSLLITLSAALAVSIACTQQTVQPERAVNTPAANSSPVTVITPSTIEANRITVAEAKKELDAGTAVFVDVRAEAAYKMEHIKGALHIPLESLDANLGKLPKGKKLIIYCSWANENTSASWASEANKKGIVNAAVLLGGTQAWVNAGFPTEKGQ